MTREKISLQGLTWTKGWIGNVAGWKHLTQERKDSSLLALLLKEP